MDAAGSGMCLVDCFTREMHKSWKQNHPGCCNVYAAPNVCGHLVRCFFDVTQMAPRNLNWLAQFWKIVCPWILLWSRLAALHTKHWAHPHYHPPTYSQIVCSLPLTPQPPGPTIGNYTQADLTHTYVQEIWTQMPEAYTRTATISVPKVPLFFFSFLKFFTSVIYSCIYIHFRFTCVIASIFIHID
jgi:hypothetical protein